MKIILTCPPMIKRIDLYQSELKKYDLEVIIPQFTQVMKEADLIDIIGNYDGWIIGDDPATRAVFEAGKRGNLKAAIKWGVGVDNVDFEACKDLCIPIINTPGVFGREVADNAVGYLIALARQTFTIDRGVKEGKWPKPSGMSLWDKKVALIGFGDIGRNTAKRLLAFDLDVYVSDPGFIKDNDQIKCIYNPDIIINQELNKCHLDTLSNVLKDSDFIVITCALNKSTKHMINKDTISLAKNGVYLVNVGRGPVVKEDDLVKCLKNGKVRGAALDVFEIEPLPLESELRNQNVIFGSHNSSNTEEAVDKVSVMAISKIYQFLN